MGKYMLDVRIKTSTEMIQKCSTIAIQLAIIKMI